jgi:deoxyribonuclease V
MAETAPSKAPWPDDRASLMALQVELGRALPEPFGGPPPWRVAACFFCSRRTESGERAWAGAARCAAGEPPTTVVRDALVVAPYEAGLLALREGQLLMAAVQALPGSIDLLLVNATGRDHPRRAGLALHLGAALGLPSVGVTNRPLFATGTLPDDRPLSSSPLLLDGESIGFWLRSRAGTRPLAVHAGWGVDAGTALRVVTALTGTARTPAVLRLAREAARTARAHAGARPFG